MKKVTTKREKCEFTGVKTLIFVNDILVLKLSKIENPVKEGYLPQTKYRVHAVPNSLNFTLWGNTARSIKNVIANIK